jgi:uncharacterized cupredoxin-like copper-binding protein
MAHASHTAGARVLTVAVAALLLGACSSTSGTAAPSATSTIETAPPSATTSGTSVDVTEKEFTITLSQTKFKPGTYTFTIKNAGSFGHNLTIEGPGVDKKGSPTIAGGSSGSLTVALQPGSYELWCAMPGHKDRGMDMRIKVS